ncbi:putative cation-transporting P-type ATPase [Alkalibacterium sp. AK22]|uniref:cation-transporting P-type ATPase n=1 Tax=Alkalibacterium sp. AK22 TaxID=1229520 RepID=UPI00044D34FD|nr:cation-transporting P-type ATPase [Alkalibacterium sp. AK22]EXJ23052.1 putative cation-transporting P-type ATPase [Alkalibacterium sp. AK22]
MFDTLWFHLSREESIEKLQTQANTGLSTAEARRRLGSYGLNELPKKELTPKWVKFFSHFNDILIYILLVAAIVTLILGHYVDTVVILLVAVVNALIGYVQENKAEKALEGIRQLLSLQATVIRNGSREEIASTEVVPGDIVLLKAGDKIPADIRLIQADHLKVEESPLTGESTSVEKQTASLPEDTVLADRVNMAYSGTAVSSGSGIGVVVSTGEETEIGQINRSMSEVQGMKTPLLKQIETFGKIISVVILALAVLLFAFGLLFHDYQWGELLLAVIGLTVAAIPEGLPAILTIILALGVQTMADKKAIMRTLPSVETLGAVTVICSDKTGTLTKNEMTVRSVMTRKHYYTVSGIGYAPQGSISCKEREVELSAHKELKELLLAMRSVNDSDILQTDGHWLVRGDPTEGCLITLAEKASEPVESLELIAKIPFDSEYKYMAGLVEVDGKKKIYIKGAPDRLFDMAGLHPTSHDRQYWEEQMSRQSRKGERVLAAAVKDVENDRMNIDHEDVSHGLTILGLTGIIDPPRENVIDAIATCKRAGIQVKMITGDHKETALVIARQLGITDHDDVIEGRELDQMTGEELKEAVLASDVFARTSPANKLQLVEALQAHGHISAMTGDGVNDAPALKRADIGVAMGIKGTEVAKEASEMVLADDNFSTIINAVREGRRVYDNLKKTILFILPTNGAEAFLVLSALLLGLEMPLTPVQILYVNMVTAVTVALALAFEPLEEGTMDRPPRKPTEQLLSRYYVFRILFVSLLIGGSIIWMNGALQATYSIEHVNTVTLHSIVFAQLFHLFNVRNERHFSLNRHFFENKAAFAASALLVVFQLTVTYVPFLTRAIGLYPIEAMYWIFPVAIGIMVFIVVEIEKYVTHAIIKRN